MQLGEVEANRDLEARVPRRPLRPRQRLAVRGHGRRLMSKLAFEQSLHVQDPGDLLGRVGRLEALPRPTQVLAGARQLALLARQHTEVVLEPPDLPLVARGFGEL